MQMTGRRKIDMVLSAFREIRQKRHLDVQGFAQGILGQLKTVCQPSGCAIMLIEGGRAKTIAHDGMAGHDCGIDTRVNMAALGALRHHQDGLRADQADGGQLSGLIPAGRESLSTLCMPVMQGDVVVGIIYMDSQEGNAFEWEDLCCADLMAEELSLALQRSLLEARVSTLSKMDSLVGCFNRSALEEDLKSEIARSRRYEKQFSLFFLEIDPVPGRKPSADTKTDDALHTYLVGIFRRNIRNIDRIYYYGDQHFVVLLPETDKIETISVASRLIDVVRQRPPQDRGVLPVNHRPTVSIGISGYPGDGNANGELLDSARTALRQARSEGGNRLFVCGEDTAPVDTMETL